MNQTITYNVHTGVSSVGERNRVLRNTYWPVSSSAHLRLVAPPLPPAPTRVRPFVAYRISLGLVALALLQAGVLTPV